MISLPSGPVLAMVIEGENAVAAVRQINGATDPLKAVPGSIRGDFATSIDENVVHASDAPETAAREIGLWFPNYRSEGLVMAKVYTRTGDKGKTSLYTGERVSKASVRVETYGTIDEADSVLGMARAFAEHDNVKETIFKIQKDLWMLMADVASIGKDATITDEHVTELEHIIDSYDADLEPLNHFIVPGESKGRLLLI